MSQIITKDFFLEILKYYVCKASGTTAGRQAVRRKRKRKRKRRRNES
jgi:hypothetical protein